MRGPCNLLVASLVLFGAFSPVASAQGPAEPLYSFELLPENGDGRVDVPVNGQEFIRLVWRDLSRDSYTGFLPPGTPAPAVDALQHSVSFTVKPHIEDQGWIVFPPSGFISYAGRVNIVEVPVQVNARASHPTYPFTLNATITTQDGSTFYRETELLGFSLGAQSFGAQISTSYVLKPKQIIDAPIKIINLGVRPRAFDMTVGDNPCGLLVGTTNNNLVLGKSEEFYTVTVEAPRGKLYYFYDLCTVNVQVSPSDQPDIFQNTYISIQVSGLYVNPVWVFYAIFIGLALLLLLVFLARRKARVEEEILGKPQKPWTIPVEVVYLRHLKAKDERAWYVVRHYLMEDEYKSAILWYKSFKASTKGGRRKERLVLAQERGYARWKRAWQRRIARPLKDADRFEARSQAKLDRQSRAEHRKQMRRHNTLVAKLEKAHGAKSDRELKKWEKEARRAEKKGLAAPPEPTRTGPDLPEAPEPGGVLLVDHKWARKAAKFRAKKVREQGDLEVKFEKADARHLHNVQRKVRKLAKRLDDPEFVAEHPLLQG